MSATGNIEPLSQEDYVSNNGLTCPNCRADGAGSTGHVQFDVPGFLFEDNHCPACGKYWVAQYRLVGYAGLE